MKAVTSVQVLQEKIDKLVSKKIKRAKITGLGVVVIDENATLHLQGYGYADLENQIKVTPNTPFRIGSITKPLTATAVMQLQEKGLLNIKDPIKKYLPDFSIKRRFDDANITIEQLMSHHSGIPTDDYSSGTTNEKVYRTLHQKLARSYQAAPTGAVHVYSNIGYGILGALIEEVSGETYEEYMQKYIFAPLQMMQSSASSMVPLDCAKGYRKLDVMSYDPIGFHPAGSVTSSVKDLGCYMKASFTNAHVISQESQKETFVPRIGDYEERGVYGLGWVHVPNDVQQHIMHNGQIGSFYASLHLLPESKIGIAVTSNSLQGEVVEEIVHEILALVESFKTGVMPKKSKTKKVKFVVFSEEDLDRYAGDYSTTLGFVQILRKDKDLIAIVKDKKIILQKGEDGLVYAKIKLFGFIPLSIDEIVIRFSEKDDQVLLFDSEGWLIGSKVEHMMLPENLHHIVGDYNIDIVSHYVKSIKILIKEKKAFLEVIDQVYGQTAQVPLNILNDKAAVLIGVGRGYGSTLLLQENGIEFSGIYLEKK
ncbi:MAG: beta-lactamase family protein [Epsilonproteobacteria bacterium]|nr:beta-lactamase family protein [Campylobacterota bacterium]